NLSDNSTRATIVLVGVASNTVQLIADHESINRCLRQIYMQPMNPSELKEIVNKAVTKLGMQIEQQALNQIVALSQGLPHYTHSLGQESAFLAINASRSKIESADVFGAVSSALDLVHQTIRTSYEMAATGQKGSFLYPQVLLACALARTGDLGYFTSADVRDQ